MKTIVLLLLCIMALPGCLTPTTIDTSEPTPLEIAASDLALAWVALDRAETDEDREAAMLAMVQTLALAVGMDGLDLSAVVPSPGIVVLVGELFPDASAVDVELYARVFTALVRSVPG